MTDDQALLRQLEQATAPHAVVGDAPAALDRETAQLREGWWALRQVLPSEQQLTGDVAALTQQIEARLAREAASPELVTLAAREQADSARAFPRMAWAAAALLLGLGWIAAATMNRQPNAPAVALPTAPVAAPEAPAPLVASAWKESIEDDLDDIQLQVRDTQEQWNTRLSMTSVLADQLDDFDAELLRDRM